MGWTKVDATEDPQFFVHVLDATRTRLLEWASRSPEEFFARFGPAPGLDVLDVGFGTAVCEPATIKTHVSHVTSKPYVRDRAQLVVAADERLVVVGG